MSISSVGSVAFSCLSAVGRRRRISVASVGDTSAYRRPSIAASRPSTGGSAERSADPVSVRTMARRPVAAAALRHAAVQRRGDVGFAVGAGRHDKSTAGRCRSADRSKFDTDGDGQVSQSEFENAIGPAPTSPRSMRCSASIDGNGDGSVSQDELQTALQKAHGRGHHHHHHDDASERRRTAGRRSVAGAAVRRLGRRHDQPDQHPMRMARPPRLISYADGTEARDDDTRGFERQQLGHGIGQSERVQSRQLC